MQTPSCTRSFSRRVSRSAPMAVGAVVPIVAAALLATASPHSVAQTQPPLRDGLQLEPVFTETGSPFGFSGFAVADSGDLLVGIDHFVVRVDAAGNQHPVRSFPVGTRVSFVVRPTHGAELFYGHFDSDALYRHDPQSGAERSQPLVHNAFDLDTTARGEVLVTANPDWPAQGAHAGVWLVDPQGGSAHREVIALTGPSGPLLIDRDTGDLYYATQSSTFPPPPGSTRVLRFDAARLTAALAGGAPLGESDASVVTTLDGAFDIAFGDRRVLHVSDAGHGDVRRVDVLSGAVDPTALVARGAGLGALQLQFVDGAAGDAATFDPFQPDGGGALFVATSDWATASSVHRARPRRPSLSASPPTVGAGATLRIRTAALPPGQPAFLLASILPVVQERAVALLDGVPAWLALDLTLPPVVVGGSADAQGRFDLDLVNPGGIDVWLVLQSAGATPGIHGGTTFGTSPPAAVRIRP